MNPKVIEIIARNTHNEILAIEKSASQPMNKTIMKRLSFLHEYKYNPHISESDYYDVNKIRILYNEKRGNISDLLITEFSEIFDPKPLLEIYDSDVAYFNINWKSIENINFLILEFFIFREFYNKNYKLAALHGQFRKIKPVYEIMKKNSIVRERIGLF